MNILLIGYRGSGKSSVGRLLARQLQMPFRDSDEQIIEQTGQTIADIFAAHGEVYFRDVESAVLKDLLRCDNQVLSLGGGIVLREENRVAMKADRRNRIIFLHCDSAELHRRIHADQQTRLHRPALTTLGGSLAEIEQVLSQRLPLYRQMMTDEIEVTDQGIEQVANQIQQLIQTI